MGIRLGITLRLPLELAGRQPRKSERSQLIRISNVRHEIAAHTASFTLRQRAKETGLFENTRSDSQPQDPS
jgi:hypothetical protein